MKKSIFLLALTMLTVLGVQPAFAYTSQVYTSYDSETHTLTYYYDDKYHSDERPSTALYNPDADATYFNRWGGYSNKVTTVVIDESMKKSPLTSARYMFYGGREDQCLKNVETIVGLGNINTSIIISMEGMFYCCSGFKSLNLSDLNTSNVEDMSYMFYRCSSLTSINLSNFNTSKAKTMKGMFHSCSSLKSLDLSSFNTSNVENMSYMFYCCFDLTSVNLSSFNTANVTSMSSMFDACRKLPSIDLVKFEFSKVTNLSSMFEDCYELTTIYCNAYLMSRDDIKFDKMFNECAKLRGGQGTVYDAANNPKDFARPDAINTFSYPGYFTEKKFINAELSDDGSTMTIFYESYRPIYTYIYWNADGRGTNNMTTAAKEKITKVIFDSSVADARPTTCRQWFHGMKNLTEITGINYLNTSECTSMQAMFSGCNNLASLDVSGFNTAKVTNMSAMFYGCEKLTTIEVKDFNTENVTNMSSMFYNCKKVNALHVSGFNTAKVTTMSYMFSGCETVQVLNVKDFNTEKVTNMSYMFSRCKKLFSLQLENWNTAKVTDMSYMFNECSGMTDVTLPSDISKVTNAKSMFYNCSMLETIISDADFSKSSATSDNMFSGCTSLKGYFGTAYNSSIIDKSYARPDHGTNLPGYFSAYNKVYTYRVGNTLYYRYDASFNSSNTNMELYDPIAKPSALRWKDYHDQIGKVVINESMKDAPLTSMYRMFYGGNETVSGTTTHYSLSNLQTITGLNNLNTKDVTTMRAMFNRCHALKEVDLSSFNTDNVTNMAFMFVECKALESLDLTSFNMDNVTTTEQMFHTCSALKTIKCDENWGAYSKLTNSSDMFKNCTSLKGGNGTAYNSTNVDATYARQDEDGQPGYFTSSTATGIEDVQSDNVQCTKVMVDGVLYLMYEGRMYDVRGQKVK